MPGAVPGCIHVCVLRICVNFCTVMQLGVQVLQDLHLGLKELRVECQGTSGRILTAVESLNHRVTQVKTQLGNRAG